MQNVFTFYYHDFYEVIIEAADSVIDDISLQLIFKQLLFFFLQFRL